MTDHVRKPCRSGLTVSSTALCLLVCACVLSADWTTDPGLYATLESSMGNITFSLCHDLVPRTAGNFLSLAEGTRAWVDFHEGRAKTAHFYDGLIFHRVKSNFVIQAGSPNKRGNDSPGYSFSDEFHASLTHSNAGVVSMANSGEDSNGSQFFITLNATPWLDNVHAVFGHVVDGMDVVSNINVVATDTNDRPYVDVVISNVTITRNGVAASNFSPLAVSPSLPDVRPKSCSFDYDSTNYLVKWDKESACWYFLFGNHSLTSTSKWDLLQSHYIYSGRYINDVMATQSNCVFGLVEVEYFE